MVCNILAAVLTANQRKHAAVGGLGTKVNDFNKLTRDWTPLGYASAVRDGLAGGWRAGVIPALKATASSAAVAGSAYGAARALSSDEPDASGVGTLPGETWSQKNVGPSTGNDIADASIAGIAAAGGIYGLYRLLSKKKPSYYDVE